MIIRSFWLDKIQKAWQKRSIVWLSGVRRVGKTTLAAMLVDSVYMNCDLPSVARKLEDPELFYESLEDGTIVIFDEVHRLNDPSRLLKIAADAYPNLKILATGSSTLAATRKFRDSLAGRKTAIYLSPVLWKESQENFGIRDLDRRLLHGGLPESLLSNEKDPSFFSEWIDSFYARDIMELFSIRNRQGFLKLLNLLLRQSGSMIDYSKISNLCDLSRPTVKAHIEALCIAHALFLLPPFHGGGRKEITRREKCYAFDTGFVTYVKGWDRIREDDQGILWEHLVLDAIRVKEIESNIYYWRNKEGREIDFVIKRSENRVDTIECKLNPDNFNVYSLKKFRESYPDGENFVISPNVKEIYKRRHGEILVTYC